MSEDEINPNSEKTLCGWCNKPLTQADSFEQAVCLNCYRKLICAGLKEEEIFDTKDRKLSTD